MEKQRVHRSLASRVAIVAGLALWLGAGLQNAAASHDVAIDVWSSHDGWDYCYDDEVDIFIRPREHCFITVLLVDPRGYATVLYPENPRHQRRLYRGRTYRLSNLIDDDFFFFDGYHGRGYISIIASRRPVRINDWVLTEVRDFCRFATFGRFGIFIRHGGFYGRFEVSWNEHLRRHGYGVYTKPLYYHADRHHDHHSYSAHRPVRHRPETPRTWDRRYSYRSQEPIVRVQPDKQVRRYEETDYRQKTKAGSDDNAERRERYNDRRSDRDAAANTRREKQRDADQIKRNEGKSKDAEMRSAPKKQERETKDGQRKVNRRVKKDDR